jgi:phenylpyruvate tautomerase PptA (4-oxalocrotonate tautomerase family)
VHAWVTRAILDTAAPETSASGESVLVVVEEVREGNWGAGGKTISLASIAKSVGQREDGPRYRWSQSYFEAKSRLYALADYPPDLGGLLPSRTARAELS